MVVRYCQLFLVPYDTYHSSFLPGLYWRCEDLMHSTLWIQEIRRNLTFTHYIVASLKAATFMASITEPAFAKFPVSPSVLISPPPSSIFPISTLGKGRTQLHRIHGNMQLSKTSTIHAEYFYQRPNGHDGSSSSSSTTHTHTSSRTLFPFFAFSFSSVHISLWARWMFTGMNIEYKHQIAAYVNAGYWCICEDFSANSVLPRLDTTVIELVISLSLRQWSICQWQHYWPDYSGFDRP